MFGLIKKIINTILKPFNIKLIRYRKPRLLTIIERFNINLIFDIGANDGEFAKTILNGGYKGRIASFEPTSDAYKSLKVNASKYSNWIVYDQAAVGDENSMIEINIAGNNAASSSILQMGEIHKESAPESKYIGVENVKQIKLDSIFKKYFNNEDQVMLKIDVQGYEEQVLLGIQKYIKDIQIIKLECSLVSLYEKDKTFEFYFDWMKELGYTLYDIEPGHVNIKKGQLLQFDAVFVRL